MRPPLTTNEFSVNIPHATYGAAMVRDYWVLPAANPGRAPPCISAHRQGVAALAVLVALFLIDQGIGTCHRYHVVPKPSCSVSLPET
jgi:hypothetical protein